jgi:hypothetical protein
VAAVLTVIRRRLVFRRAVGAGYFQRMAAVLAELGIFRILVAAVGTRNQEVDFSIRFAPL